VNGRARSAWALAFCIFGASLGCAAKKEGGQADGGIDGGAGAGLFIAPDGGYSPRVAPYFVPGSRTLTPASIQGSVGDVVNTGGGLVDGGVTRLSGAGARVTFDFGVEVGGVITLEYGAPSDAGLSLGLAFTESSQYIGTTSDASNGGSGADGALTAPVTPDSSYAVPIGKQRGGFRYLTAFLPSAGWVELTGVSLQLTAAPAMPVPNLFLNYFSSSDELLNRIWYAGAYTVELNLIDPTQGRVWPPPGSGWDNSGNIGSGSTILVDGAKRDRTVWSGDMGVSTPTAFVSLGDTASTRNGLTTLFAHQKATGELPFAGPEVNFYGSDVYHLWTLNGVYDYFLFSADKAWLDGIWVQYAKGVAFSAAKIDAQGLLSVNEANDWARSDQGGENIEANALFYRVLDTCSILAAIEGDSTLATTCASQATGVQAAANARLWDADAGLYRDNPTSTLHPQDGNALAIWYGLVDSPARSQSIVAALKANWNAFGARTPEWTGISPFPGSLEVLARFAAGDDQNALDLIRLEWGYMLNADIGTGSTFWEGYNDDGSFAYGGSYMSCAHGWATGPTSALTTFVLGIAPELPEGSVAYSLVPHPGDLTHAEGTLVLPGNQLVWASWDHPACGDFTLEVHAATGAPGVVGIPTFGGSRPVSLDGVEIWNGASFSGSTAVSGATADGGAVYFGGVSSGDHVFAEPSGNCD